MPARGTPAGQTGILVSASAMDSVQAALDQLPYGRRFRLIDFEHANAADLACISIALISRDITGTSTKYVLDDYTSRYYEALLAAPRLQWVHVHSAGLDRPVFGQLQARGVVVSPSSGVNAQAVAHTALAGILALARRFPQIMRQQIRHEWRSLVTDTLPADLPGQTAIVVGWGPIGRQIGALLCALGMRLIVARHSAQPVQEAALTVSYDDVESALPQADWLVLACPLSDATNQLIGSAAFAALPPSARLVNVSRGEVVDEQALIQSLQTQRLAGAFLDVFKKEPLPADSPLWDMDHVIVSPHAAGHAAGNNQRVIELFVQMLKHWEPSSVPSGGKPR